MTDRIRTRFALSRRLIPVAMPGRPARILSRRLLFYDRHGAAVYEATAVDDELRFVSGYLDGWGRWQTTRPTE